MSTSDPHADDRNISEKLDRVETIIETLDDGDISLEQAKELHEEGRALLDSLQADMDLGEADITERA